MGQKYRKIKGRVGKYEKKNKKNMVKKNMISGFQCREMSEVKKGAKKIMKINYIYIHIFLS